MFSQHLAHYVSLAKHLTLLNAEDNVNLNSLYLWLHLPLSFFLANYILKTQRCLE